MAEPRKLDEISARESRDLQAAPLSAGGGGDDADAANADAAATDPDTRLATTLENEVDDEVLGADLDDQVVRDEDALISEELSTPAYDVILESDLEDPLNAEAHIHAPDMDAPNVPGEIDIEDLDEDALDGAGLPPDARLDPLED